MKSGLPPQKRLVRNSALCHACGDEIESKHRHDFVSCTCGNIFVDGGLDYIRRGFMPGAPFEDTSAYEEVP